MLTSTFIHNSRWTLFWFWRQRGGAGFVFAHDGYGFFTKNSKRRVELWQSLESLQIDAAAATECGWIYTMRNTTKLAIIIYKSQRTNAFESNQSRCARKRKSSLRQWWENIEDNINKYFWAHQNHVMNVKLMHNDERLAMVMLTCRTPVWADVAEEQLTKSRWLMAFRPLLRNFFSLEDAFSASNVRAWMLDWWIGLK